MDALSDVTQEPKSVPSESYGEGMRHVRTNNFSYLPLNKSWHEAKSIQLLGIIAGAEDHPLLPGTSLHLLPVVDIRKPLDGPQQECLLRTQDQHVADVVWDGLPRVQEEGALAFADLLRPEAGHEVLVHRVHHDAILTVVQGGDGHLPDDPLVHVRHVGGGVLDGDQPLLPGAALLPEHVHKRWP